MLKYGYKAQKTIWFVMRLSVCLSVIPSAWNNSALSERIFVKFIFGHISKISQEKSSFIKFWQEYKVLYMTYMHL